MCYFVKCVGKKDLFLSLYSFVLSQTIFKNSLVFHLILMCFLLLFFRMWFQFKMLIALLAVTTIGVFLTASYTGWPELKMPNSCQCEKCFSKENVFLNQHLNRSIELFLSATTILSGDEYDWWRVCLPLWIPMEIFFLHSSILSLVVGKQKLV